MSTLWTPSGEHPVGPGGAGGSGGGAPRPSSSPPSGAGAGAGRGGGQAPPPESEEEMTARMAELRRQLAETPAALVVANHCFGLFELAALHLSLQPPQLAEAQVAIDALGAVVEGLAGRLGEEEEHLREGLAQLRLAFVQMRAAASGGPSAAGGRADGGSTPPS